jgi:DNA-binding response OmpR family regulator
MNGSRAHKILIVDDNEVAANVLGKLLTFKGYTVERAYTGKDALRAAARFDPNIALVDIGLPDISGYDIARKLRGDNTPALLVALTGFGQESDKEKAKEAGFDHHLTKPIGIAELESVFSTQKSPAAARS